jgi:uncharacterized protein YdhG (YjbR/CyaY superfamily)
MKKVSNKKYPEQMAFLQENYGFTRAHANAVVMFSRGSMSSRRYESPKDYFAKLDKEKAKTMRKIFSVLQKKYPKLELVISWNQPMLKNGEKYIFGCSASKNHLTIAPWDPKVLKKIAPMLEGYVVNKKTVRVPSDWTVDEKLLIAMVRENLKS